MEFTKILEAAAVIIAAIMTAFIIPFIKSKTTAEQQKQINNWVRTAVVAAEQLFTGSKKGEEKKEHVINFLADNGMTLDNVRLDALIEAAVYQLKNGVIPTAD